MNAKERFQAVMHSQKVDRIPVWDLEGITEQAIRLWTTQGLPLGVDVQEYVGFDPQIVIPVSANPIPNFIPRTIASDDESVTATDIYGFTVRYLKEQSVSPRTYYYLRGCVESRSDWDAVKKRYDPSDIRRFGEAWGPELLDCYRAAPAPLYLWLPWGPGRSIKNGYMLGLERFLDVVAHEPEFIEDIFEFWCDFLIELVEPLVKEVQPDIIFVNEDGLAYKTSSLISPAMYRRLWLPHVRRFSDYVRSHGVEFVGHYTSGNIKPLMPALIDAGINLFAPLEVASGLDARDLRKEYGKDIVLMGNISRAALMAGTDAVDKEFNSKVPWMMDRGGYIPAVDDMILPDISFQSYMHYIELVKQWRSDS